MPYSINPCLISFSRARFDRVLRQYADELFEECLSLIALDGKNVPEAQREWRIGATFSWHYVRNVEYRFSQLITSLETIEMARNGKPKNTSGGFGNYTFVRCELRKEDKEACKEWMAKNTKNSGALIHDAVASGYKLSVSFSSDHDTFTASLTGKEDHGYNAFKTLTARHKEWHVAVMTVLFKAVVMFNNSVWETDAGQEDDGWA